MGIEVGEKYKFNCPTKPGIGLEASPWWISYIQHNGQTVTVVELQTGDQMFVVRAEDGTKLGAYARELEPLS